MEEFVFISPCFSQVKLVEGCDRDDAVEAFASLMFVPGWTSNQWNQEYGKWLVFEKDDEMGKDLLYSGHVKN